MIFKVSHQNIGHSKCEGLLHKLPETVSGFAGILNTMLVVLSKLEVSLAGLLLMSMAVGWRTWSKVEAHCLVIPYLSIGPFFRGGTCIMLVLGKQTWPIQIAGVVLGYVSKSYKGIKIDLKAYLDDGDGVNRGELVSSQEDHAEEECQLLSPGKTLSRCPNLRGLVPRFESCQHVDRPQGGPQIIPKQCQG